MKTKALYAFSALIVILLSNFSAHAAQKTSSDCPYRNHARLTDVTDVRTIAAVKGNADRGHSNIYTNK